jgi:hypothetical protein
LERSDFRALLERARHENVCRFERRLIVVEDRLGDAEHGSIFGSEDRAQCGVGDLHACLGRCQRAGGRCNARLCVELIGLGEIPCARAGLHLRELCVGCALGFARDCKSAARACELVKRLACVAADLRLGRRHARCFG